MSEYLVQYNVESNVSSISFDGIIKLITNDLARNKVLRSNCLAGAKLREAVFSYIGSALINKDNKDGSSISIKADSLSVDTLSKITRDPQGNLSVVLKFQYDNFPTCLIKMTLDKFTDKIRISNLSLNN
jgi:hypothetical protein